MSLRCTINANRAMCLVLTAVPLIGPPECSKGATITNILIAPGIGSYLGYPGWQMQVMTINTGDTVVWVNQQTSPSTNFVESYGGEWSSPPLNPGDSFSFTFTNSGFYAYRTGLQWENLGYRGSLPGTITVSGWTNAPPAVTITTPGDGFVLPPAYPPRGAVLAQATVVVQASVTNAERISSIEYYANTNLIGTATSPPFGVPWVISEGGYGPAPGPYTLVAKAVDNDGSYTLSQPVNVLVGLSPCCWGARVLPGGKLMLNYAVASGWFPFSRALADSSESLPWSSAAMTPIPLRPGVFVDESLPASAGQSRFYRINYEVFK